MHALQSRGRRSGKLLLMLLNLAAAGAVQRYSRPAWRFLKDFQLQQCDAINTFVIPTFGCCEEARRHNVRSLHGRMFYKRRPRQVPHPKPRNYRKKWLEMSPQKKGICEKVFVVQPRKPGSGLRKVAYVRLSTGRRVLVFIPGIGHNLNVHSVVLVRGGRTHDIPGCNLKAIRGAYDLLPVKGRMTSRSKYGVKKTDAMKERALEHRYHHQWLYTHDDRKRFNRLQWPTWEDPEGNPLMRPLDREEPVPVPRMFNHRWKFIQWKKANCPS